MNGLTNRQFALMMAIEARKVCYPQGYRGNIMGIADEFYNWLEQENKEKEK